jgi:hypothetical protein
MTRLQGVRGVVVCNVCEHSPGCTVSWTKILQNYIPIYVQQDATLHSLFCLEIALHVLGGTTNHHQERIQLYLQHLVFVTPLLLPAAITADSSNGLTNTRCCRYCNEIYNTIMLRFKFGFIFRNYKFYWLWNQETASHLLTAVTVYRSKPYNSS